MIALGCSSNQRRRCSTENLDGLLKPELMVEVGIRVQ
jgi:hypothetical protein